MNIIIDFVINKSLGQTYPPNQEDNKELFDSAQKVYLNNKLDIDKSIEQAMKTKSVGVLLGIPTLDFMNPGFIKNLNFIITKIEGDNYYLSLTKVG